MTAFSAHRVKEEGQRPNATRRGLSRRRTVLAGRPYVRKKYVVAVIGEEREEGLAAAQAQRELLRLLQCAVDDHRKHNPHQQQVPYGARHRDGEY